jgi:hypothetical protein
LELSGNQTFDLMVQEQPSVSRPKMRLYLLFKNFSIKSVTCAEILRGFS